MQAQTFTAGVSGLLDTVRLPLWSLDDHGQDFVDIRNVTATGTPGNSVLARGSLDVCRATIDNIEGNPNQDVAFPNPASVVAGHQYAIVVSRDPSDPIAPSEARWFTRSARTAPARISRRATVIPPGPRRGTFRFRPMCPPRRRP